MRDKRRVLLALAIVVVPIFIAGMVAAWLARNDTICPDGKPPLKQRGGIVGPTEYLCHDGRTVTK